MTGSLTEDRFDCPANSSEGRVVHFVIFFDCPSHLLRARLVLEAWWAKAFIQLPRPVLTLSIPESSKRPWETIAGSCGILPGPLTRQVLESRLGGLWQEVRQALEG